MILHTILICVVALYALASLLVFGLLMGACLLAKRPMPSPVKGAGKLELADYPSNDHRVTLLASPAEIAA